MIPLRLSIRSKLLLTLAVATVFTVTVSVSLVLWILLDFTTQESKQELHHASQTIRLTLELLQKDALAHAETLALLNDLQQAVATADQIVILRIIRRILQEQNLGYLVVTDASGIVLARAHAPDRRGDAVRALPVFDWPLRGLKIATITRTPTVPLVAAGGVPLFERVPPYRLLGAVVTGYVLDKTFVTNLRATIGKEVSLISERVRLYTTLPVGEKGDSSLLHQEPFSSQMTIADQTYLRMVQPLQGLDGGSPVGSIEVAKSEAAVKATLNRMVTTVGVGLGIAGLLILGLAFWFASRLTSPLKRLTVMAQALGKGEFNQHIALQSGDELETLGEAFNQMAINLQHAESTIRESEAWLRLAIQSANVGLWEWNIPANTVYFSPEWKKQLGYEDHEIPNSFAEWENRLHPEDRDRMLATVKSYLESPWPEYEEEFRLRHKDGSYRWILTHASLILDADGQPVRLLGSHIDITTLKQSEKLLELRIPQQSAIATLGLRALEQIDLSLLMDEVVTLLAGILEVEYCKILELLPDGKALLLRAGVGWKPGLVGHETVGIETSSQAGYTLYSKEPVIVKDLRTETRFKGPPLLQNHNVISGMSVIIHGHDKPYGVLGVHTSRQRVFTQDDIHFLQTCANVLAASIEHHQEEEQIRSLNANLERLIADRTQELQAKNRDLEAFTYSVSHDLRAPLRAISGFAQILLRRHRADLNAEGQHYLQNIVDAGIHMGQLIDDLLQYSRLGRRSMSREPVPLPDLLTQIIETLAPRIAETGANLDIPADLPVITGNRTLFRQIFTNLLENALTYHQPGIPPYITVRYKVEGDHVLIAVHDNGIEIPLEFQEKIFHIFQRLHSQEEYPGTGIGLAIVQKAVELLGGKVWVESTAGEGSTFYVHLPQEQGGVAYHV